MNLKVKDADGIDKYIGYSGEGSESRPLLSGFGEATDTNPFLYQYLDLNGDGTGNTNMSVNGSVTPVLFKLTPPAGQIYRLTRVIISLRDTGSFDSGGWGSNGGTPLPNGLLFQFYFGGVPILFGGKSINSHYDLAGLCHDMTHASWGSGDEFITSRLTFTKAGRYILLDGDNGDYAEVSINDDLSYLVDQRFSMQGHVIIK